VYPDKHGSDGVIHLTNTTTPFNAVIDTDRDLQPEAIAE
jgi:hypothetical protein